MKVAEEKQSKIHSRRWLKRNNYVIKDSIMPTLDYALNGLATLILMR